MFKQSILKIMLFCAVVGLVVLGCGDVSDLLGKDSSEGMNLIEEAWDIIHEDFVDSALLDDEKLAEAAIEGLVDALDDPYTAYLNPEESELSSSKLEGDFGGIGATMTIKDGMLTVVAPIAGSPAEEAGIRPGDVILEVDGQPTTEMSLAEAVLHIRGKEGTVVTLLIRHEGEESPVEVEITREEIKIPSVEYHILDDDIGYVRITNFSDRTDEELKAALEYLNSREVEGLVLDLRNNPGGIVSVAVAVLSQFLSDGIGVYAVDGNGNRDEWGIDPGGIALEIPLAVLINENSASASEIVAGAIQDYGRGTLIGVTTFGKGSMNHVQELSNGGSLYVTFARWYTPKGRQIDREGISPDIEVELTGEDVASGQDPQLDRAIELLVNGS